MSKTNHTPGPWGCTYTSNHAHDYRLTKAGGHSLPVNAEGNDHSEQRANARLIAAAPELLEAIKRIVVLEVGLVSKYPFLAAVLAKAEDRTDE